MVERPEEYHWSSYGSNAWGDEHWLKPHEEYRRLGRNSEERCHAYREIFRQQFSVDDLHVFRKATHYSQPVGDERFRQQIEKKYMITLGRLARGRPRKGGGCSKLCVSPMS
jgi:putative transposase